MLRKFLIPFFILLLLFPQLCLRGASGGLTLWLFTLVPTFFPFLFLSDLMISYHVTEDISRWISPVLRPLFGVTSYGSYVILMGFLCGYPMGARLCGEFARQGLITKKEGEYLLTFCNHPSPMFLTGYILGECMITPFSSGLTLALLYLIPIFTGILLKWIPCSPYHGRFDDTEIPSVGSSEESRKNTNPNQAHGQPQAQKNAFSCVQESIMQSFRTLLCLGGFIILFNILSCLTLRAAEPYPVLKYLLAGILEMTTGAMYLAQSGFPTAAVNLLIPLCALFGGFSVLAQIKAMLAGSDLKIMPCVAGKILQCGVYAVIYCMLS